MRRVVDHVERIRVAIRLFRIQFVGKIDVEIQKVDKLLHINEGLKRIFGIIFHYGGNKRNKIFRLNEAGRLPENMESHEPRGLHPSVARGKNRFDGTRHMILACNAIQSQPLL